MSEAADRKQEIKRHWAEPGSRHDAVVRAIKFGLPVIIVGCWSSCLPIAPFDQRGDVSFILDKNEVDEGARSGCGSNRRAISARTTRARSFEIVADRAVQQSSNVPVVMIEGMRARLNLARGPLNIAALKGRYDLERRAGDGRRAGPRRWARRLPARDPRRAGRPRQADDAVAAARSAGRCRLASSRPGRLSADLDERTVRLEGGVRLKI